MVETHMAPGESKQPRSPEDFPRYTVTDNVYVHGLYPEVKEAEVAEYLGTTKVYDSKKKKWTIPDGVTGREPLVNALYTLIWSIMNRFVKTKGSGPVKRVLFSTQGHPECEQLSEHGYPLCPVLFVHAVGPAFQNMPTGGPEPPAEPSVGYSDMATFCCVRLESELGGDEEQVDEMETYARYLFQDQPSRRFVRALMLTEKHARVFHFDRAGTEVTPPFDIHDHPATFLRLVAGLSSMDERALGFDTSIAWSLLKGGKKLRGIITTTPANGSDEPKTFRIIEQLYTPKTEIRGRATTCWRVQDPDTLEELVVKDLWRLDSRRGEHEYLRLVKGIPGTVQMVSCEAARAQTREYRCPGTEGEFENWVADRVVMEAYGGSVACFREPVQVLGAVRDAVAAHWKILSDAHVLHRDVAPQNILLGKPGAPEGERGVLIDFDLAFEATAEKPFVLADHNMGVRPFQSLSVLSSQFMKHEIFHDYLDDLESFFYVLIYLMLTRLPNGTRVPHSDAGPAIIAKWNQPSADDAFCEKHGILGFGADNVRVARIVKEKWGEACEGLYRGFRGWLVRRRGERDRGVREGRGVKVVDEKRDGDYGDVVGMFDVAIKAIVDEAEGTREKAVVTGCSSPPEATTLPTQPVLQAQPRRSARLNDKVRAKAETPPNGADTIDKAVAPTTQPRRSVRIEKRRLEREQVEDPVMSRAKSRRTTKGARTTKRARR